MCLFSMVWANIHILSRMCRAPTSAAENTPHRASNPIVANSPRTLPSPRIVSIGLFSTNTNRGLISQMILDISPHNPLCLPLIPFRPVPVPAPLMSWQGNPPHTISTFSRHGCPLKVRTSSHIGNMGNIPSHCRWNKTFRQ